MAETTWTSKQVIEFAKKHGIEYHYTGAGWQGLGTSQERQDVYGYVDNNGMYHGPADGTHSVGNGWIWQSGGADQWGFQLDGTKADGMWVENPDLPKGNCGKKPVIGEGIDESAIWLAQLKDYTESHPNDIVAQWLYSKQTTPTRNKVLPWLGNQPSGIPEPAWMGQLGVTTKAMPTTTTQRGWGPSQGQFGWLHPTPTTTTTTIPGETTGIRPLGGQANLTSDQLENLMYYYGYLQGGKPSTAKGYLQEVAYRLPNWWQDYLASSQALLPMKTAPQSQFRPAWQR